jgi:hypothetical protein
MKYIKKITLFNLIFELINYLFLEILDTYTHGMHQRFKHVV